MTPEDEHHLTLAAVGAALGPRPDLIDRLMSVPFLASRALLVGARIAGGPQ